MITFQAQRVDVHAVVAGGRIVEHDHPLAGIDLAEARRSAGAAIGHLRGRLGPEVWDQGMNPGIPETKILDSPYPCTGYCTTGAHGGRPPLAGDALGISRPPTPLHPHVGMLESKGSGGGGRSTSWHAAQRGPSSG
ncbi:hypothetical protein [Streptomyces sp. NPDC055186]